MEKLYRQVAISERLPKEDGNYYTEQGLITFEKGTFWQYEGRAFVKSNSNIINFLEPIPYKPNRNTGSFLKPDQREHADEVFESLTKKTAGGTTKDCECDKLQADKSELLEALEKVIVIQDKYFGEQEVHGRLRAFCFQIESLIEKHKK